MAEIPVRAGERVQARMSALGRATDPGGSGQHPVARITVGHERVSSHLGGEMSDFGANRVQPVDRLGRPVACGPSILGLEPGECPHLRWTASPWQGV